MATVVLVLVGVIMAEALLVLDWAESTDKTIIDKLSISEIYQVTPISVENAGWQIALIVENQGSGRIALDEVYVDNRLVGEVAVIHGDRLLRNTSIVVSIPLGGLVIRPGVKDVIYIWIGSDLYNTDTQITIMLQESNQFYIKETINLK